MQRDGFQFDFETRRFLSNRWETDTGRKVLQEIIEGIKNRVELRAILDRYVLSHPENSDPYGHPIYPREAMGDGKFWVLTQDDLRGIKVYREDFSNSPCLEKKSLSYARFYDCDLSGANVEMAALSSARFEKCKMNGVIFAASGGFEVAFRECQLKDACFWDSGFRESDFTGSDFSGAYFEGALLEDIRVNHSTKFDPALNRKWSSRTMPLTDLPDIYRALRMAYENSEIWSLMDHYLFQEKTAQRKYILWPELSKNPSRQTLTVWLSSFLSGVFSGYATKPLRVGIIGVVVATTFAALYFSLGTPTGEKYSFSGLLESIYFSATTFVTLGYGDLAYPSTRPIMRILSTVEAWIGAAFMALFVVAVGRKVFR